MELTGGCYCGAVRYRIGGEVLTHAMCFCRECQHVAGGGPTVAILVPEDSFAYTKGTPTVFARGDLAAPVSRQFCGACGTQLATRSPRVGSNVIVKVGSLDDSSAVGMPQVAVFTSEKQVFHCIPEGVAQFDKNPPARGD